jgi:hypothetical protein
MGTNVYCDMCAKTVGHDDSFVVESVSRVAAFHFECGALVYNAMQAAILRDGGNLPAPRGKSAPSSDWKLREMEERLDAVESLARRTASVWRLWLNDAEKGAVNPGTFDAMKNLLGIEKA